MKPGQKIFDVLRSANGEHVPLSHLAAVAKMTPGDVMEICERLIRIGKVNSKYQRNGSVHEMHYWVDKGRR